MNFLNLLLASKSGLGTDNGNIVKLYANPPATSSGEYFGQAVSISGDGNTILIGAPGYNSGRGAVYFFTRSGNAWIHQYRNTSSGEQNANMGKSLSLNYDGTVAWVGEPSRDGSNPYTNIGRAYVFTYSGGSWTRAEKTSGTTNISSQYFGCSVSVNSEGNTALIGQYGWSSSTGRVQFYVLSGTSWTREGYITASDGSASDYFSYSVSISGDGNTALIGAYGDDDKGSSSGSAYVFTRSEGTWTQQAKLLASDGVANSSFGYAVAISSDGKTALIGALTDENGTDSGSAYVFAKLEDDTWVEQAKLMDPTTSGPTYFGRSLSLSADGNVALIGAYRDGDNGTDAGAAYLFTRSEGGVWTQKEKLLAPDGQAGDYFGISVALSADGNTAVIGANNDDDIRSNSGAAYVFMNLNGV